MAVRIRMKKMGRRHRPFFRVCAVDGRAPRDGKVIEELGFYDPMVKDIDARTVLKGERIDYWLGVGAQPSDKVRVLIKKYGSAGTHLEQQKAALVRLKSLKPQAPPPMAVPKPKQAAPEAPAEGSVATSDTPEKAPEEKAPEEKASEEKAPKEAAAEAVADESQAKPEASGETAGE